MNTNLLNCNPMKQLLLILTLSIALTSCATIYNGSPQTIWVLPYDYRIEGQSYLAQRPDGPKTYPLPTLMTLSSHHTNTELIAAGPCSKPEIIELKRSITPSFWFNIFNGGIGFIVDGIMGSFWAYDAAVILPSPTTEGCQRPAS